MQNRDVFAIVNNSSFAFLSYRYLLEQGVPMIGGGFDGTYYTQKGNEDIISALGKWHARSPACPTTTTPKVMKELGAKKVAALAYGASASSTRSRPRRSRTTRSPRSGLEAVYTNTSVDFGTTDVGPLVLGIKNSGADAAVPAARRGKQHRGRAGPAAERRGDEGEHPRHRLRPGAPRPARRRHRSAQHGVVQTQYKPVELKDKATKQFQADLKKYAGLTGVPDYGQYTGYITCDLAILGLQNAGKTPTRRGFIDGLRKLGTHDGAGLTCRAGRHQPREHRKVADDELLVLHVREGREVRAS